MVCEVSRFKKCLSSVSKWNLGKVEYAKNMFCNAAATEINGFEKFKWLVDWTEYDEANKCFGGNPGATLPPPE